MNTYLDSLLLHIAFSLLFGGLCWRAGYRHGKGELIPSVRWHAERAWAWARVSAAALYDRAREAVRSARA
jgi:hypothetical protein